MFESDSNRGTGRTKRMVESLPEGGCVVVIHQHHFTSYIRAMIGNLRGGEFLKTVRIITLENVNPNLMGITLPIYIDHYVQDYAFERRRNAKIYNDYHWLLQFQQMNNMRNHA